MKKQLTILSLVLMLANIAPAQKLSDQIAATIMNIWKDSFALDGKAAKWTYDMGVILKGIEGKWLASGNGDYYRYIQKQMDFFVNEDGSIKTYKKDEFNIDHINNGRLLLTLWRVTQKEKYRKAAMLLALQLAEHPRTQSGGFWHKKIYPNQIWLDGLYMAQPFYAELSMLTNNEKAFHDIANQFNDIAQFTRDSTTGLLYHAWDESRQQQWADKSTGRSPLFWSRAMGWYVTALVDVLDYFPYDHFQRRELITTFQRTITAIEKQQDAQTGLWKDILAYDGRGKEKNYFEASASSQFTYAIAKGVRKGYLNASHLTFAQNAWTGMVQQFIKTESGQTNLYGTVKVSGLGGKPYRDGSFDYYMSEPVITNDPKGLGAFLLAANEMDLLPTLAMGKGKQVWVDNFFNSEKRKGFDDKDASWHYTFDDRSNGGYYNLGFLFNSFGVQTFENSYKFSKGFKHHPNIYIIVDPDTEKENQKPNFIKKKDIKTIKNFVRRGGVLVLLGNDKGNCEFTHFNQLAKEFGIQFIEDSKYQVQKDAYEQGTVVIDKGNEIFPEGAKIFIKEVSPLQVQTPARTVLQTPEGNIMAVADYGKGKVFALGDPWIYNEYLDGRRLPSTIKNFDAAKNWIKWLIKQINN